MECGSRVIGAAVFTFGGAGDLLLGRDGSPNRSQSIDAPCGAFAESALPRLARIAGYLTLRAESKR